MLFNTDSFKLQLTGYETSLQTAVTNVLYGILYSLQLLYLKSFFKNTIAHLEQKSIWK